MTFRLTRIVATAAILACLASPALAHTGHDTGGFLRGLMHPVGGLDHVLAMVAVGLLAAHLGGRALWLVPAAFLGAMAIGGALGVAGFALPHVEIAIALSVVVLGLALTFRLSLPTLAAMALVGAFAIFHGHAHGVEMPPDASGSAYAAGFMLATALLHGAGVGLGLIAGQVAERGGWRVVQAAGGAIAFSGILILAQAL